MNSAKLKMPNVRKGGFRRRFFNFSFYIFNCLLAAAFAVGCAIPQVPYRTVYEDPVNFVRLELDTAVLPEWPPSAHSHPATISEQDMARILKSLLVQENRIKLQKWIQGEAPRVPAFKEEEIALLASKLSEALAQAQPNERVTYYLSRPQTSIKRVITTGGLYVRGTELHFLLGNWQIVYGIPAYGMIYDRRYPMSPTAPKGFNLFYEQESAVVKHESSLWDRLLANEKDELILDLTKVLPGQLVIPAAQRTMGSIPSLPLPPAA
jgi:hypothetical protein